MKIIEVIADAGNRDTIQSIAEQHSVSDTWFGNVNEDGRVSARLLVSNENRQDVLDAIQSVLQAAENARIIVIPTEAVIPRPDGSKDESSEQKKKSQYSDLQGGNLQRCRS